MTRFLAIAAVGLALVATTPATAQVVPTAPCPTSEKYTTVGLSGKTENVDPLLLPNPAGSHDEPFASNSFANHLYRIDLSGSSTVPNATKGNVTIEVGWEHDGDYDVYVYDAQDSQIGSAGNGFVGTRPEVAVLSGLTHCSDIRVEIQNYLAPPSLTMTIKTTIGGLKP